MFVMKPRISRSPFAIEVAAIGVLALAGCGSSGPEMFPVRGEVIYDGKPLPEGTVVYLPTERGVRQATGGIQPDGSFVLSTHKSNDGVMRGSYQIAIYAYKPHPGEPKTREEHEDLAQSGKIERGYIIPEKYADPATSGLSDVVNEKHSGFKKIELMD